MSKFDLQELKQSGNFFSDLVAEHIKAMVAYWDLDLVCRFANSAYLDWFGISREQMIDKMTLKDLLGPTYFQNIPYIEGALRGEAQTFERDIVSPQGVTRHAIANYYPDVFEGKVRGFVVHVADVSSFKHVEQELSASHELVREQNKRLLNFSNIVSHNLRSYSKNLGMLLELFSLSKSEESKKEMMIHLLNVSKGFSKTVEHLNEITHVQNQEGVEYEFLSVRDAIENVRNILQQQISEVKATINIEVPEELRLFVNPAYLESILLNFLTNTIKYRQLDRPLVVDITSTIDANHIILNICDNGRGIDLEKNGASLFGMYKTFHGNADARGIGLFISKYQMDSMGGEIKVKSKVNEGTCFELHFLSH